MIDLYCNDGKCPICEQEVNRYKNEEFIYVSCNNGCFKNEVCDMNQSISLHHCNVFNEEFDFDSLDIDKFTNKVIDSIKYYKEDDRYIAEILAG